MKKKYVAILMGIVMTAAVLNGCGQKEDTENSAQQTTVEAVEDESSEGEQESDAILGEVTEIGENSITIALGTMKERGEAPQGEEKTITITDNTVITKMSMGKPGEQAEDSKEETTETISLSDIATGDTVSVVLDADGNATSIMVQSMGGGMGGSPS